MLAFLKRFLGTFCGKTILGLATKVVEVAFELMTPLIVARMLDTAVATHDIQAVARECGLLVLLATVGYCFTLVCQKMAALVAQGVGTNARNALFAHVGTLSSLDVDRFGAPSLVTRVTNDVNQVQLALALGIRQITRWPFLAVGSIVATFTIDARLGLIFLVCVPLVSLTFWFVMSRSVPYFRTMQGKLDRVGQVVREGLSGIRVIRAFGQEAYESTRFRNASREQVATAIAVGRLSASLAPATFLIMNLGVVAILWSGAARIQVGGLTQGQVVAFVNYMSQTLISIVAMANFVVILNRGAASASRIMEVLDCKPTITDGPGVDAIEVSAPALALDNVCFTFADAERYVVDNVSLELAQGQTLGIIGGTGSGKSSLVSLINRQHDATSGVVSVMGHDVRRYTLSELRSHVAMVPQRATLVTGTIASNLRWRDPEASDGELWQALALAQAADFVGEKSLGLGEPVEAGGKNFSGGQRQRLTIARALVGSPRILVLDDSASALDFKTDAALRHALGALAPQMTLVIVSQRVSSVMTADKILVLDHGRMAGLGTHQELMAACPIYREICLSQLSPEEVA